MKKITDTFNIPRICIFAIISAVYKPVTAKSQMNVAYCRNGKALKVFGVLRLTQSKLSSAQKRINRRTQSYRDQACRVNVENIIMLGGLSNLPYSPNRFQRSRLEIHPEHSQEPLYPPGCSVYGPTCLKLPHIFAFGPDQSDLLVWTSRLQTSDLGESLTVRW